MRTDASRRQAMGAMLTASIFGATAWAAESPSDAEYNKLAAAPKSPPDHRKLAKHYRTIATDREAEAKAFDALATQYKSGLPGVTDGQAYELSRALRHAAEHARDFAEALDDIAEVHEGTWCTFRQSRFSATISEDRAGHPSACGPIQARRWRAPL